ncbi:MAG: type II secretion system protein GspE, partial [Nitrospirae bacterium]|nr:type II secretion system protein GspE [Nitrospirota bacterium]
MVLKKKFLGEMLIEAGVITKEQRDRAMQEQKRLGKRLGETLVGLGFITDEAMAKALSEQMALPFRELRLVSIAPEAIALVPESFARKHRVLPLDIKGGMLTLAMADPLDIFAVDEIRRITKIPVNTVVVTETDLLKALDKYYKGKEEVEEIIKAADVYYPEKEKIIMAAEAMLEDTPIVKLV